MSKNCCDWQPEGSGGFFRDLHPDNKQGEVFANQSSFYRFSVDYSWDGVGTDVYQSQGEQVASILRHIIIGSRGESCQFNLRYFEIGRRGYSSLQKHPHEHVVICVRGKGRAAVGDQAYQLNFLDTLYIAPEAPHQLSNAGDEPFGFLCIINAESAIFQFRLEDELDWLQKSVPSGERI